MLSPYKQKRDYVDSPKNSTAKKNLSTQSKKTTLDFRSKTVSHVPVMRFVFAVRQAYTQRL